jgi:hypothetical protein
MHILTALSLAIPILLQIGIIVLLLRRSLQKRFRWFFIYVCYALFELTVRLVASPNQRAYFIVYWSTAIPSVVLTLLALWESFLAIFWPERRLRWFRWIFWLCIAIAVMFAAWLAWAFPPKEAGRLVKIILGLEFGLDIVISTCGLLYAGAIVLFGILEHQRATAIILGFTANSSIAIFAWITRSAFGTEFRLLSEWIPAVAYIVAEAIWMKDLLRAERLVPKAKQTVEQMNEVVNRYIVILHKYLGRET